MAHRWLDGSLLCIYVFTCMELNTSLYYFFSWHTKNSRKKIFGPSGSTASKTGMILSCESISVKTVHFAIHKCRLELHHAKKELYVKLIQKCCWFLCKSKHCVSSLLHSTGQSTSNKPPGKITPGWSVGKPFHIKYSYKHLQ